ncbi:MAG TPA: DUF2235 domain-containing protein, partial [Luteimonas sp.]|nr:DUF2235 domain-containing protein [Luteimonas sp.]
SDKAADDQSAYPANTHDLQTYRDAQKALARFPVPILLHAKDGHERLYVAAFDGTGNDADGNPNEITNVGMIRNQISARQSGGNQSVAVGYESGIGTQSNAVTRLVDGALGYSYEARIEQMYWKFAKQVKLWRAGNPDVKVRLADIGFSRGAVEADGFARLVDKRGVLILRAAQWRVMRRAGKSSPTPAPSSRQAKSRRRWPCSIRSRPAFRAGTIAGRRLR